MPIRAPAITRSRVRLGAIGLVVAAAYVAAAHLGFRAAFVADQVSTVWAPTGIAQAALILWGRGLWPAIWLAAFTANASLDAPLWMAASVACGNTLEAVLTAWILQRFFAFDPSLRRTRSVVAFVIVGGILSTAVSATIGVASLCAAAQQPWHRFSEIWPDWWLGDAVGSLVVAPAILTVARTPARLSGRQRLETATLVLGTVVAAEIIFGQIFPSIGRRPLEFAIFPLVIAAAVRLSQPATSLVVLTTSVVTILHTLKGIGPFSSGEVHYSLVLLQVFMGVLAGTGLVLAAAMFEWRTSERRRAAAHAVSNILAGAQSVDTAAPAIVGAICDSLEWPHGALWLVDREAARLRCVAVRGGASPAALAFTKATTEMLFASGVGLPGRVWASGAPAWIPNVLTDPNFPRAPFAKDAGFHGAFGFPICAGAEVVGAIECFSRYVATPDPDLLHTMSIVGSQIGEFIARKRVEAAVMEGQRHTRAILESALDPIIGMDHHGAITEFNPAAERTFGFRRSDVLGRELVALVAPPRLRDTYRAAIAQYVHAARTSFPDVRVEATAWHADGREFPVEVAVTKSAHEEPPRFTGFVRDLTSRREAEREREGLLQRELTARRDAEAANRAKDEFLATLSHELRTPLNAIVGWTRMLLDHAMDERSTRRALEIIDRNAHLQVQLVADILDVSRIITGGLRLDLRPVELGSIIGAALDAVRPAADARRIRLRSQLPRSIPLTEGDPQRLQQIVWNLLANAVKFTPPGGQVDVDLFDPGGDRLCIRVQDNGDGIDPMFLPHVFERFTQADGSTSREHGGLGLGLAIVRHLVELHGGSVRAESSGLGKGSTFVVELPKTDVGMDWYVRRPSQDAGRSFSAAGVSRGAPTNALPLTGCTALVVDDDADARELLSTALSSAGANVRTAASVGEALSSADERWPDVLLADIGLPGADGYALIRELRTREAKHRPLAAAAITAYARDRDREFALAAGFDQHFAKPMDPIAVVDAVRSMLSARPSQQL